MSKSVNIRPGSNQDLDAIYDLVVELAVYEKEPEAVTATLEDYKRDFSDGIFRVLVAEADNEIIGMALYYMTYSTWKGRMLYLEDFIVKSEWRRRGIGETLFLSFLQTARDLGCVLTKWQVLDWNTPAVNFYEKIGATIEKDWWNGKLFI